MLWLWLIHSHPCTCALLRKSLLVELKLDLIVFFSWSFMCLGLREDSALYLNFSCNWAMKTILRDEHSCQLLLTQCSELYLKHHAIFLQTRILNKTSEWWFKKPFLCCGLWSVCMMMAAVWWRHAGLCSLCGQASLMHCLSYLMPGKVNEVVALLEEVEMEWVAKTRGSLEMKRPALSDCKWQFWWITWTITKKGLSSPSNTAVFWNRSGWLSLWQSAWSFMKLH